MDSNVRAGRHTHQVAIVIPVYRGEKTLERLLAEVAALTRSAETPGGRQMRVDEAVLVYDNGPDKSDLVMRKLADRYSFVRLVWLAKNYGQHAATIAGIVSTSSEWVVTMDEDGQFDPEDIKKLLDRALDEGAQLVYASPKNPPPHGHVRNLASATAKTIATRLLAAESMPRFNSFRLMVGEIGRGIASYVGSGVYLDVALSWAFGRVTTCEVMVRDEGGRTSGYSYRKLLSHFWQLVITIGPRPLRLVSLMGILSGLAGGIIALVLLIERLVGNIKVQGWTSLAVIVLLIGGMTLLGLGIVAEYVGMAVRMAMGRPLYLTTSDPASGPLQEPGVPRVPHE